MRDEQRCRRCGKEAAKDIHAPSGYQLGPSCYQKLLERVALRKQAGTGPISLYICKETQVTYWQDKRFEGVCPESVSCWACDYMRRQVCEAEALVNRGEAKEAVVEKTPNKSKDIFDLLSSRE